MGIVWTILIGLDGRRIGEAHMPGENRTEANSSDRTAWHRRSICCDLSRTSSRVVRCGRGRGPSWGNRRSRDRASCLGNACAQENASLSTDRLGHRYAGGDSINLRTAPIKATTS